MSAEAHRSFDCFGGTAAVHVRGTDTACGELAADRARAHFSMPIAASRASTRTASSRASTAIRAGAVPAQPPAASASRAPSSSPARTVAAWSTRPCSTSIERAGYRESLGEHRPASLADALSNRRAADRKPRSFRSIGARSESTRPRRRSCGRPESGSTAAASPRAWLPISSPRHSRESAHLRGRLLRRPPRRRHRRSRAQGARRRPLRRHPLHELALRDGAVATSGIGRRCLDRRTTARRPPHPRPAQRPAGLHRDRPGDAPSRPRR